MKFWINTSVTQNKIRVCEAWLLFRIMRKVIVFIDYFIYWNKEKVKKKWYKKNCIWGFPVGQTKFVHLMLGHFNVLKTSLLTVTYFVLQPNYAAYYLYFFLIGILSIQRWTATTRHQITSKRSIQEIGLERTYR